MLKTIRTISTLAMAVALCAVPATAVAAKGGQGKSQGKTKSCAKKTPSVGYQVSGTLVSVTPDDTNTPDNEATVTLNVAHANSHAWKSGELVDTDPATEGVQATYTVPADDVDGFVLKLNGYEGTETPTAGDRVKVKGRIARTKPRCAPEGTSVADRYAAPDVRRVTIWKAETEVAPEAPEAPQA
jgi:hypothetical protein